MLVHVCARTRAGRIMVLEGVWACACVRAFVHARACGMYLKSRMTKLHFCVSYGISSKRMWHWNLYMTRRVHQTRPLGATKNALSSTFAEYCLARTHARTCAHAHPRACTHQRVHVRAGVDCGALAWACVSRYNDKNITYVHVCNGDSDNDGRWWRRWRRWQGNYAMQCTSSCLTSSSEMR